MHVETSIASRVRAFEVSPALFRTLALATAAILYAIIVTGATVRLTASGLGCDHWPGCQAGQPFPEKGYHSYIEFGNRLVGGIAIVAALLAALAAIRAPRLPRYARWTAAAVFAGTLAQAPLGYLTVRFHLNPYLVISHFLLSALVLAGAVVAALAAAGGCLVLLVSGTVATASGPHPGDSSKIHRLWRLQDAVFAHSVGTAIFGICFVFMLGYLVSRRSLSPRLLALTVGVLGLVGVQITIGAVQYHTRLPWWLVLIHVATAAAVWTWVVALAVLFRRPLAWLVPRE